MIKKINIWIKIVIPYTLLLAVVTTVVSIITINIIYKGIDDRIRGQMVRAIKGVSSMGFLLNDDFLKNTRISEVIGSEIIAYNKGRVFATSFPRNELEDIMGVIYKEEIEDLLEKDSFFFRDVKYKNEPFKVVYYRLDDIDPDGKTILALIVSTKDIEETKSHSAMTVILVAISGVVLVAILGSIIAFNITAPVKQLVLVTEKVASGDLTAEAKVNTHDEIGILAQSFNQMTRELKTSRDRLVQSERLAAVGQLSAGIAHEIRNPLTSMKMTIQLLKRKLNDQTVKESLLVVLDEINRLEIIVNGILDFARPMELTLEKANIANVIDEVIKLMKPNLTHKKIEIIEEIESQSISETMIDINKMKQVFMNIILNSIQAMPNGGNLKVHCEQDNEAIKIEISDSGEGMSKDISDRVFEPFFSAKSGGTGLGLTNAKRIIELHKGEVFIDSIKDKGTKVTLILPYTTK
ncbi:TPA: sensor histidine kinase [bacterium]|nr:sensor histidine kinase [bacterium]